ncbi:MAG: hypothetical protein ACJ73C_18170 [Nitrososphaeraceae archaeon]
MRTELDLYTSIFASTKASKVHPGRKEKRKRVLHGNLEDEYKRTVNG